MLFRYLKKLFSSGLFAVLIFVGFVQPAQAANEFTTSLTNIQIVDEQGNTHVQKNFVIKNNLSTVYITKYGIEVSSNKITQIRATNQGQPVQPNIVKNDSSTTIEINFPDVVVGKGQERNFTIEYSDPDAAIISGNVLEVYAPRIAEPAKFDNYSAILKIPTKFGQPTIANPIGYELTTENKYNVLNFGREGETEGISVIFGEKQFFDFALDYSLKNPTSNRGIIQIALPPDTPYQKVEYSDISPRPEKIEVDGDGNWIATYLLEGDQEQTVSAKGVATIYLEPTVDVPLSQPQIKHIQEDAHWEVKDPIIQAVAQKYRTPHEIFNYVVDTLSYNNDRITSNLNRPGAKTTLENPSDAVCQEFTDVFVAVARANHIPARQATGYAFTSNPQIRPLSLVKDVLHAWPEYFDEDKQRWIPVDPTWANTTGGVDYFNHLDFSHFVFAYQGLSSEIPYPAGSYRDEQDDTRTVFVNVSDHGLETTQELDIQVKQPFTSFFKPFGKHTLVITNKTGTAWYHLPIELKAPTKVKLPMNKTEVERLLPYQTVEIPFAVIGDDWVKTQAINILITIDDKETTHQVIASSRLQELHIDPEYLLYFGGSFLFTTTIIIVALWIYRKVMKKKKNVT